MKRDMELFRKLMFAVEESQGLLYTQDVAVAGYNKDEIGYHFRLMLDAGFAVKHGDVGYNESTTMYIIDGLTNSGHDFIDNARNSTSWNKAMDFIKQRADSVSMDVLADVIRKFAVNQLFPD